MTLCRRKLKRFGNNAEIRPFAFVGGCSNISIGDNVVIRPLSVLFANPVSEFNGKGSITIEDNVLFGPAVRLFTGKHRFSDVTVPISVQGVEIPQDIVIRTGSWIGAGTTILPGVTIGRNAVIGAGSVVTRNIPDGALAVGAPAQVIRQAATVSL